MGVYYQTAKMTLRRAGIYGGLAQKHYPQYIRNLRQLQKDYAIWQVFQNVDFPYKSAWIFIQSNFYGKNDFCDPLEI